MLLTAFIGPAVGHRIDRFGGRGVLTASSLVFACGLALLGAAPNLAVFALGWGVIGMGMGMGLYEAAFATLTAIRSEEHTSELQSLMRISYAVFCLKKKNEQ